MEIGPLAYYVQVTYVKASQICRRYPIVRQCLPVNVRHFLHALWLEWIGQKLWEIRCGIYVFDLLNLRPPTFRISDHRRLSPFFPILPRSLPSFPSFSPSHLPRPIFPGASLDYFPGVSGASVGDEVDEG